VAGLDDLLEVFLKLPEITGQSAGEIERVGESFGELDRRVGLCRVCRLDRFDLSLQGGLLRSQSRHTPLYIWRGE
jgi:hypothetical protein